MRTKTSKEPVAKKGKGRPIGSKTKNRAQDETVLVSKPTRRPMHYSLTVAAAELGMSHDALYRLSKTHRLYQPAARIGRTSVIYTDIQIQFMSLAMRHKMTEDRAVQLWECIEDEEVMSLEKRAIGF